MITLNMPLWRRWTLEHINDTISKLVYEEKVPDLGDQTQEAIDNTLKMYQDLKEALPPDRTIDMSYKDGMFTVTHIGQRRDILSAIIAEIIPDTTIGKMTLTEILMTAALGEHVEMAKR